MNRSHISGEAAFHCDSLSERPSGDTERKIYSLNSSERMIIHSMWKESWESFVNVYLEDWVTVYPTKEQQQHSGHGKVKWISITKSKHINICNSNGHNKS